MSAAEAKTQKQCSVPDCDRKHYAKGLCNSHYMRLRVCGALSPQVPIRKRGEPQCSVPGCEKDVHGQGMCAMHYARHFRTGNAGPAGLINESHGLTSDGQVPPEYMARAYMLQRCDNPKNLSHKNYGARGITVCEGYRTSPSAFMADVGPRPSPKHSIDRKDNDKGYWCGKCSECVAKGWPMNLRWATRSEQNSNRRAHDRVSGGRWRGRQG